MTQIPLDDARQRLDELLDDADRGERVVISRGDGASYEIVPVRPKVNESRSGFGSARGLIWMAPDFDEPLADFEDYT